MILIMVSRLFRIPDLFLKSTCPVFTPPYILQRIIPPVPSRSFLFSRECNPYCKLILKRCRFYALPGSWTVLKEFRSKKNRERPRYESLSTRHRGPSYSPACLRSGTPKTAPHPSSRRFIFRFECQTDPALILLLFRSGVYSHPRFSASLEKHSPIAPSGIFVRSDLLSGSRTRA